MAMVVKPAWVSQAFKVVLISSSGKPEENPNSSRTPILELP
jgi:hypothetical protein